MVRYRVVDMRELDGDLLLESGRIGDNVIAILARLRDHKEAVRKVVQRIAVLPRTERETALRQLLVLAGLRHLANEQHTLTPRRYFWILAILCAILALAPLRTGDLTGYDDAQYAHIAKDILRTGDWLVLHSNGEPALENPPMLEWMEASLFAAFGFSDSLARLPAALCGFGTIILVYWLARKLTGDPATAVIAMFVMATTLYFLKYMARGMTDVPFTFFALCAVCAWSLTEDDPRWYLAVGACTALAQLTRSMMGLALPAVFVLHLIVTRRRPPVRYALPALMLAYLPLTAWYAYLIHSFGAWFLTVHSAWLRNEVYGGLAPSWRRYTGAFEYAWMLARSYWPWLPAMIAGIIAVIRGRDRRLWLLILWVAVVFALCAAARSRVLRYMLPAYPAFAILAALGLKQFVPVRYLRAGLRVATPILALAVVAVAAFPRTHLEAAETRPIARAATAATQPGERVAFYDDGQPRFDEDNQFQWYGDRFLVRLFSRPELLDALRNRPAQVFVLDKAAYRTCVAGQLNHSVIAESGHLICFRLCASGAGECLAARP
ncbi:MAG TPA: glycosyltransferase family 39 protein [Bryobacteraceae bacterium]|nr:glycosyltransferase family 39 protein [Bryobacteraceae bacterium]